MPIGTTPPEDSYQSSDTPDAHQYTHQQLDLPTSTTPEYRKREPQIRHG